MQPAVRYSMQGDASPSAPVVGSESRSELKLSQRVANLLAGSWRPETSREEPEVGDVTAIMPYLLGSGTAPLAWWRVRRTAFRNSPPVQELRRAYRETVISGALREREIEKVFALLRAADIEPILFKGWAIARLYPEPGLRPLGDIDLYVAPEDQPRVAETLVRAGGTLPEVDSAHDLLSVVKRGSWSDAFERSVLVRLGTSEIRILGPEDHLAYLCIHFLKHGGWRPLWLCDIAIGLEARPAEFDWDLCLGTDRKRADWIACAIGLAHVLLNADVRDTPVEYRAHHLPRWLAPTVLNEWERPRISDHVVPDLIAGSLHRPGEWPRALRARWLSPIEATLRVGGSFNSAPRLPYQVADYVLQLARFFPRLARIASQGSR